MCDSSRYVTRLLEGHGHIRNFLESLKHRAQHLARGLTEYRPVYTDMFMLIHRGADHRNSKSTPSVAVLAYVKFHYPQNRAPKPWLTQSTKF